MSSDHPALVKSLDELTDAIKALTVSSDIASVLDKASWSFYLAKMHHLVFALIYLHGVSCQISSLSLQFKQFDAEMRDHLAEEEPLVPIVREKFTRAEIDKKVALIVKRAKWYELGIMLRPIQSEEGLLIINSLCYSINIDAGPSFN